MAEIPVLTDAQIDMLIERATEDPLAPFAGLQPPVEGDMYHRFNRNGEGSFLGFYSEGDGVSHRGFREAVEAVMLSRGNMLRSRAVVGAYHELLAKTPEDWAPQTALVLCMLAPLLGVMAEQDEQRNN